jgi:hypothetical protein
MKRSISVLITLAVIVALTATSSATTKTKSSSPGVVLTNAYDAFGKNIKGLKQDFGFSAVIEYGGENDFV